MSVRGRAPGRPTARSAAGPPQPAVSRRPRATGGSLRHKRVVGRVGLALTLVGALGQAEAELSPPHWTLPPLLPTDLAGALFTVGLVLMFWASVCPACGGAVWFHGSACVSCEAARRGVGNEVLPTGWTHLPPIVRLLILCFGTMFTVVAVFSLAGVD